MGHHGVGEGKGSESQPRLIQFERGLLGIAPRWLIEGRAGSTPPEPIQSGWPLLGVESLQPPTWWLTWWRQIFLKVELALPPTEPIQIELLLLWVDMALPPRNPFAPTPNKAGSTWTARDWGSDSRPPRKRTPIAMIIATTIATATTLPNQAPTRVSLIQ